MERPDLSTASDEIIRYIEYLEKKLNINEDANEGISHDRSLAAFPPEPETTVGLITISHSGMAKRTYRHLYLRQHRGGMGVFDLDAPQPDFPLVMGLVDENQTILALTNRARAFRLHARSIESAPVRSKGINPFERLGLDNDERVVVILPEQARGYIALLGASGKVRLLRHHLFGEHMKPGTVLFNPVEFGPLTSACWTPGDAEVFIVTAGGMGIRFSEKSISPQGELGIRVGENDRAVGIASVTDDSALFLIGSDGRGTTRQMNGFAPNKSPGGSGKIAFKNSKTIGAISVEPSDDLFVITRNGKLIRFMADEVPLTEAPVQGVNCVSLRSDEVVAFTLSKQNQ